MRIPEGLVVATAFVLGFGLSFFDKGIYWDDWAWFRQPWAALTDVSAQLGSLWPGWTLAASFQSQNAVWATRIIVMAAYLLAALWFLGILRELDVDRATRLAMALVFATLPVNGARIPISSAAYGIALALFVGGFRLVVLSYRVSSPWPRVFAAAALLLSLRAASFGVFLPAVYLYVVWREGELAAPSMWMRALLNRAELLAVPIVYLLLRLLVLVPHGAYSDYNEVTGATVIRLPSDLPRALWHSFVAPMLLGIRSIATPWGIVAGAVIFLLLWAVMSRSANKGREPMGRREAALWASGGVALVVVAVMPYLIVGKMPALSDFDSRHQLLVPLGAALACGAGLRLVFGPSRRGTVALIVSIALLCGGFIAADASNSLSYMREHFKRVALMDLMRQDPAFKSGTTFLFADETTALNANQRTSVRNYEYAGMMSEVFGDQTRFGVDATEYGSLGMAGYREQFTALNKMGDYVERPPQYVVKVKAGPKGLGSDLQVLSLLSTDLFQPSMLPRALQGTLVLTSERL